MHPDSQENDDAKKRLKSWAVSRRLSLLVSIRIRDQGCQCRLQSANNSGIQDFQHKGQVRNHLLDGFYFMNTLGSSRSCFKRWWTRQYYRVLQTQYFLIPFIPQGKRIVLKYNLPARVKWDSAKFHCPLFFLGLRFLGFYHLWNKIAVTELSPFMLGLIRLPPAGTWSLLSQDC
jgi:hypothetical protein